MKKERMTEIKRFSVAFSYLYALKEYKIKIYL